MEIVKKCWGLSVWWCAPQQILGLPFALQSGVALFLIWQSHPSQTHIQSAAANACVSSAAEISWQPLAF